MAKVSLQLQGDDTAALVPGPPHGLGGDKCRSVAMEAGLVLRGDEAEPPGLLKFQNNRGQGQKLKCLSRAKVSRCWMLGA